MGQSPLLAWVFVFLRALFHRVCTFATYGAAVVPIEITREVAFTSDRTKPAHVFGLLLYRSQITMSDIAKRSEVSMTESAATSSTNRLYEDCQYHPLPPSGRHSAPFNLLNLEPERGCGGHGTVSNKAQSEAVSQPAKPPANPPTETPPPAQQEVETPPPHVPPHHVHAHTHAHAHAASTEATSHAHTHAVSTEAPAPAHTHAHATNAADCAPGKASPAKGGVSNAHGEASVGHGTSSVGHGGTSGHGGGGAAR